MSRAARTWWTARPSRFAGWTRGPARAALVILTLCVLASLDALRPDLQAASDPTVQAAAIDTLRHGGEFYPAVEAALRSGDQPVQPLAFSPPTLAVIAATLPDWTMSVLLYALAGASFAIWYARLAPALTRPGARLGAALLLAAGFLIYVQPTFLNLPTIWSDRLDLRPWHLYQPEIWAGLLVALSLGLWRRDHWVEAAALGLAAAVVREVAAVYLIVMALFALHFRARREMLGWAAALLVAVVVTVVHWRAAASVAGPPHRIAALTSAVGIGGFVRALAAASPLAPLPPGVAGPVIALAAFGWTAWAADLGPRVAATLGGFALLFLLLPGADPAWAYLIAGPLLAGLAFAPDGLRDLLRAAAGERRRITVTRVAP